MVALTASMLARRTDIPADTIRYYERAGLLPAPAQRRDPCPCCGRRD